MRKESGLLSGIGGAALTSAGIGAIAGASAAGEGNRLKGALGGAALGGALGYGGTKMLAKAPPLLPGATPTLKGVGTALTQGADAASGLTRNALIGGTLAAPAGAIAAGTAAGYGAKKMFGGQPQQQQQAIPKVASLCASISGTINMEDFNRFNDSFVDPTTRRMIEKSASVQMLLSDLVSTPIRNTTELRKAASLAASSPGFDVIQIRPSGYGYLVKTSAAPEDMAPQEQQMSAQEAEAAGVPQEAMQAADEQGAATMTNVQAAPDPMVEQAQPAMTFGTYKVTNAQNGRQVVGFVIPGLFDPVQGQPTQMSLFTTGNSYALQPQITGVLTGISFNLPESNPPRGMGIFYKTDGKTLIATVPYTIVSEVTVEGRTYYSVQTQEGAQMQMVMSEGLQRPVVASESEIAMPADYKFLPLDNPIQLAGGEAMMKAAQAAAWDTMCEIRAWPGGVKLSGPVFEKLGSGDHDWYDGLFYLAASGLPQNVALPVLEKAAHTGDVVRLFGMRPLSSKEHWLADTAKEAAADMIALGNILPRKVNLIKEAAAISMDKEASAMVGTATVDSILALNFLNPENVSTYAEHIPQLQQSAEKLAELVLACQLGLSNVSKTAAVRAMFAVETVVEGLMSLKEYQL